MPVQESETKGLSGLFLVHSSCSLLVLWFRIKFKQWELTQQGDNSSLFLRAKLHFTWPDYLTRCESALRCKFISVQ